MTYDNYSPIDNYSPLLKSECSMQGMPVELRSLLFMGYITYFLFVSVQVYGNVRQYVLFYLHNNHMLSFWLSIVLTYTVHNIHMYCYSTHGI